MLVEVRHRRVERRPVVVEEAERTVTGGTQQRSHGTSLVIVVDGEILGFSRRLVWCPFGAFTNRADATLLAQHILIPLGVDTKRLPLPLLDVMRMAQIFRVYMVVARLNCALARRLFPLGALSKAVSQQPLVVRLAQALGLHRIRATLLNALVWLVHDARLDRASRRYTSLELHVVGETPVSSVMFSAAAADRANVVFFTHKNPHQ